VDLLAGDDARRAELERAGALGADRAPAVDRLAQRVDDATEEALAGRDLDDVPGRADRVVLLDERGLAEQTAPTSFSSRLRAIPMTV